MTDIHPESFRPHRAHTLVSWPAVIAGALVAIAVGAMLNLLGVALGAASLDPYDLSRGEAEGFSALAGIWMALANMVGLFVGGFVASRSAKHLDHHKGMLSGVSVWAVAFAVALFIAGATAAGGVTSILDGASERANAFDTATAPLDVIERSAGESEDAAALPPPIRPRVDDVADATSTMALWAFLTMLLGAVGAVFGARYGQTRHGWETRIDADPRADLRREPTPTPVETGPRATV